MFLRELRGGINPAMFLRRFIGLQLISLVAVAAQPLRFHADTSETVNVLYHAACLSGTIGCSKPIFEAFWHHEMKWQPADQTALDQFAAVFDDAVRAAPTSDPARSCPISSPLPRPAGAAESITGRDLKPSAATLPPP
jgi:hypothetical protein